MSDRLLSLIDVQVGMYRLSLQTKLTPPCFRFFWGLIMLGNTLKPRFKNPFDVNVEQAVGIGGGLSRQSINDKQNALKKVRIDGEWLVKIKAGSRANKRAALYEINYDLLVPPSLAVPTFEVQPSRKIDEPLDGLLDEPIDDHPTSLRSDQKRGEKIPPTPLNVITTGKEGTRATVGNGGDGIFANGEKTEKELEDIWNELRYLRVDEPARSQIAREYQTRYIQRQILQLKKDYEKGQTFSNSGGLLVSRIQKQHITEDYPS